MLIINTLSGLLILTSLGVITAKTSLKTTALYAVQSMLLVLIFICLAAELNAHELYMWSASAVITKVILLPAILWMVSRKLDDTAIPPSFNLAWLIPITAAILSLCYLAANAVHLPLNESLNPTLSVSFSHFLLGLVCIVTQRNILKQVFGFCLMENGSHLTLALLANKAPELMEIGIATDAFFAVMIMLVLVTKIYRALHSLDAKQLMELRG